MSDPNQPPGPNAAGPSTPPPPLLPRRSLLQRAALGGVALGLGGLTLGQTLGYGLPAGLTPLALSAKEWLVLEAVARRVLDGLDERAAPDAARYVDGWLARQAPWVRQEVRGLLHLFEASPPWFTLRLSRFTRLDPAEQDRYLRAWQTSSSGLVRQGFLALKGLCVMGGWRRPESFALCGYDGPLPGRG